MSADNQIVVAAHTYPKLRVRFTATVVQCPSDLLDPEYGFEKARECFLEQPLVWFEGPEALGRAKQLAHLIREDFKVNGWILEYQKQLFIEISHEERWVYRLSRRGRRIS